MNEHESTADDRELIERLVKGHGIGMLTRCSPSGLLESKPMTVLDLDDAGAFWFYCEHDVSDAVTRESYKRVNLAFSDEANAKYVSISGQAELIHDRQKIRALWSSMAKPWFPEGPDSPRLALLKVVPEAGEYWDGPGSRLIRLLSMAASIASGKPVGMGEHGKLTQIAK